MRDEAVDLWALDEVHFQQQGSRCRMWIPPETRDPVVYHHPTRKSVGYFAAVRLRDGRLLFRRETVRFNGESFREFLQQFREASRATSRRVIAISDNAQYHRSRLHLSWRQRQAPQFRLDFLPPYSPELNPVERVWKTYPPPLCAQPLLRIPGRRGRSGRGAVRRLDQAQRNVAPIMRNYLRRYV
jgi:DDE superfamily endonuclease